MNKFNSTRPIFRKKQGAQNQSRCARLIEKQLETIIFILCYLNSASSLHFVIPSKVFAMRLCNVNVV